MHPGTVITFSVILEHQLPVRLHVIDNPLRGSQSAQIPLPKFPSKRREPVRQWHRFLGQVHKNETLPNPDSHREERVVFPSEAPHLVHVWRADQAAVEAIGPGMIGTLDCGRMSSLLFAEARSAMPADIVKSADLLVSI